METDSQATPISCGDMVYQFRRKGKKRDSEFSISKAKRNLMDGFEGSAQCSQKNLGHSPSAAIEERPCGSPAKNDQSNAKVIESQGSALCSQNSGDSPTPAIEERPCGSPTDDRQSNVGDADHRLNASFRVASQADTEPCGIDSDVTVIDQPDTQPWAIDSDVIVIEDDDDDESDDVYKHLASRASLLVEMYQRNPDIDCYEYMHPNPTWLSLRKLVLSLNWGGWKSRNPDYFVGAMLMSAFEATRRQIDFSPNYIISGDSSLVMKSWCELFFGDEASWLPSMATGLDALPALKASGKNMGIISDCAGIFF